ncbi:Lipoprotein-anchoring transpeptidase ErfK/SrfK [Lentzea xinjiangensis]|uniref:Lipoprotein-anchoring transpeptidase ErfK/SrfK n=1 Tax=Lentzea xinjiangensis TaxID=402600 RepID=A0A1H9AW66_9PSEU|nr:Ig-like domain-containing protein [Lentzea xinjiangensis]SEP81034.1 Lipoprotein-anchoring transpeptidase ErfK/SrfK [Lentzea xinjiangensis]
MFRPLILALLLVSTACGAAPDAPSGPAAPVSQEKAKASLTVTPASGEGVSPSGPFQVGMTGGSLTAVALTGADGKVVKGELSGDRWVATEDLGYDKVYRWSGSARGEDGAEVPVNGSFRTLKPQRLTSARMNVGDNQTYGIAMPIKVTFSAPVQDKASVQKAMTVKTSVPTEGAWAWLSDTEAHWRPREYFKPNTEVSVDVDVYGVPFGGGAYGAGDLHVRFKIADRALVVKADTQSHRFVVYRDGVQLHDFPASYGLDSDPRRVTRSGTHVVMQKEASRTMTNAAFGYKDVPVTWAVLISDNGEFVHEYANSMASQGRENVSHGCANLSPANAKTFYDLTMIGDPVEVLNSSVRLGPADGDYHDWAIDWATWTSKSAVTP